MTNDFEGQGGSYVRNKKTGKVELVERTSEFPEADKAPAPAKTPKQKPESDGDLKHAEVKS